MKLVGPAAEAGTAGCGILTADARYFLCVLSTLPNTGDSTPSGSLILLRRLDPERLGRLGAAGTTPHPSLLAPSTTSGCG